MKRLWFALFLGLGAVTASPAHASNGYDVMPLPVTADGAFYAHRVMPNGFITGAGGLTGRAVVWTATDGVTELSWVNPNTMMAEPLLGAAIGLSTDQTRVALGASKFVWVSGALEEIPFLEMGSNFSPTIVAMNAAGLVVGFGDVPGAASTAFVWDGADPTVLGPMDMVSRAEAISTNGTIVGVVNDAMNHPVPYVFQGGGGVGSIGVPEGFWGAEAATVTDAGDVVGRTWSGTEEAGWAYIGGEHFVFPDVECVRSINAAGVMLAQQGLGCGLATNHPPLLSTDGGETWIGVSTLLEGEAPYSPSDQLQGVGVSDAGRIVVNVVPQNLEATVLVLTPEGSGDLDLSVEAPAAVQGGPGYDYDVTLDNIGIIDVTRYDLSIMFSGDAKIGEGVIPTGCTTMKDEDQWVSQIDCEGLGPVNAEQSDLNRFTMVPSQLGTVTANFVASATLADGTEEYLVTAIDTVVSDDSADLSVELSSDGLGKVVVFDVENLGPDEANSPRVEIAMQGAGFEELSGKVAEDCVRAEADTVVRCTIVSLASGEKWSHELLIVDADEGTRVEADVESDTPDPDLSNNNFVFAPLAEDPRDQGCGGGCSSTGGRAVWPAGLMLLFAWRRRRRP